MRNRKWGCVLSWGAGLARANAFIQPQPRQVPYARYIMDSAGRIRVRFLEGRNSGHVIPPVGENSTCMRMLQPWARWLKKLLIVDAFLCDPWVHCIPIGFMSMIIGVIRSLSVMGSETSNRADNLDFSAHNLLITCFLYKYVPQNLISAPHLWIHWPPSVAHRSTIISSNPLPSRQRRYSRIQNRSVILFFSPGIPSTASWILTSVQVSSD